MAYEIKDAIQAIGTFAGEAVPLGGASVITQSGFRSFTRTGVGLYSLELDGAIAPRAGAVVAVPKAGSLGAFSGVCTGATVELAATDPATGAPADCPLFDVVVYREPTGPDPVAPLPVVPGGGGNPINAENTSQSFRATPVGQQGWFTFAPVFTSRAVDRFWFYILFPPAAGESISLLLFRHRNPPGGPFTYTQIADTYVINNATPFGTWVDLRGELRASAADYDQLGQNDAITLTTIATAGVGQSLLGYMLGWKA